MTRTPKQIAADKLDLQMYRLSDAITRFGNEYGDRKALEAGNIVDALRSRVRVHMHPKDREETNNG